MRKIMMLIVLFLSFVAVCTVGTALTGCSKIKDARIAEVADDVVQMTPVICSAAKFFAEQGREIPGMEVCEKLVPLFNRDEVETALKIVDCAKKADVKTEEFKQCALANGLEALTVSIEKLKTKLGN